MTKSYQEMTPQERLADRIQKNRNIDAHILSAKSGPTLDTIVAQLDAARQRATYGAVAQLVGVQPRSLMTGRRKQPKYSWVVSGTTDGDARKGWPTGYTRKQIHPECLSQAEAGLPNVIESADELKAWLNGRGSAGV